MFTKQSPKRERYGIALVKPDAYRTEVARDQPGYRFRLHRCEPELVA